ncbi:hypothetical protein [Rubritalea sp.]|uniref:hypothetical protein n=1 Tax=Rubritalea sp. TaxID=2109375 RepID=UPI003241FFFE
MGNATFKKRKFLGSDLYSYEQRLNYVVLFGVDLMRECNAVITHKVQRIFMKPEAGASK